jgi:hypothetical protein
MTWCGGVMEWWSVGFGGIRSNFTKGQRIKKNRPISVFDSQYSIIPSFHYSIAYLTVKTIFLE